MEHASPSGRQNDQPWSENQTAWFVNGDVLVYTDAGVETVGAIAIKGDRISFVGDEADARQQMSPTDVVFDLAGQTVMPGIHDAHMHGKCRGIDGPIVSSCDMGYEGGTIESILGKLKAALTAPGEAESLTSNQVFVATFFFGPAVLPAGRVLTRHDLDRLSKSPDEDEFGTGTTRPIVVGDKGGHSVYVNSQAIANAQIGDVSSFEPGHIGLDEHGEPNGVFNDFAASWGDTPPPSDTLEYDARIIDLAEANRRGVTSMFEACGSRQSVEGWAQVADRGMLTARVNQSINVTGDIRGVAEPEALQAVVDGIDAIRAEYGNYRSPSSPGSLTVDTVKVFADGESEYPHQTAAMLRPYNKNVGTSENPVWQPTDHYGDPSCSDAVEGFALLDARQWNIHVHCLGDRATREALDNFETAQERNPQWDRRHVIAHLAFAADEDLPRLKKLGVVANMSMQWARRDAWSVDAQEGYIPEETLKGAYPARQLVELGTVLSGGSDWPVDPLNPWLQIQTAVTREGLADPARGVYEGAYREAGALRVEDALKMHTIGGAVQMHQDDVTGSIEVGKLADLIIVDRNITRIPADQISDTQVSATLLGGVLVSGALPDKAAS